MRLIRSRATPIRRGPAGHRTNMLRLAAVLLAISGLLATGSGPAHSTDRPGSATPDPTACPPQDVEVGQYVQLESTCTWYADYGKGAPVVLLHGAVVDSRWWDPNLAGLTEHFHVYTQDLRAHGRTPDVEGPLSYEALTQDTIQFLETVVGEPVRLVGYSTGAAVAMMVAIKRPDLVERLVLMSTGFHHEGAVAGAAGEGLDVDATVEFLGESYGEVSPHGEDYFRVVVEKVADLSSREPAMAASELRAVGSRTLVMVSDDDVIKLEHTLEMYRAIPNSELAVVPGTSHFHTQEKPELVNTILLDFLINDPVPIVAPIRRAQNQPTG